MKIFVLSGLALGVFCATASAQGASQDVPAGYEEFTFKQIGAPNTTAAKRITVQIDPAAQARRLAGVLPPPENPIPRGGAAPGLLPVPPRAAAAAITPGIGTWFPRHCLNLPAGIPRRCWR